MFVAFLRVSVFLVHERAFHFVHLIHPPSHFCIFDGNITFKASCVAQMEAYQSCDDPCVPLCQWLPNKCTTRLFFEVQCKNVISCIAKPDPTLLFVCCNNPVRTLLVALLHFYLSKPAHDLGLDMLPNLSQAPRPPSTVIHTSLVPYT